MHEDEARLNVLRPDIEPRATSHIAGMHQMIQTLIDKGFAYAPGNGDVYYRVGKFVGYGKLSRKKIEDLRIGARIEVDESKQDPLDFVLWKGAKPGEPSWQSSWGEGRPGWHIECSVMSTCCLGETFDIHGGGPDLVFPHHENEIAQSEAATGKLYANAWMHAGAVRVDGEKMSKSLGNFFTVREVLAQYPAEAVRYFILSSHYRSPLNYAEDQLEQAKAALTRFYTSLRDVEPQAEVNWQDDKTFGSRFAEAMDDDFNTALSLSVMADVRQALNKALENNEADSAAYLAGLLLSFGDVLGLFQQDAETFLVGDMAEDTDADAIDALIVERNQARADKNWSRADDIRDQLTEMGVVIEDAAGKTSWRRA
ncbi:cysteine--tRNA ligase, partial [Methylophaga thiooxydans]|uniref:cysteine--tRNA ligase n=1 Tax=Methylophaga thiooxydans TaxID=392484 RepID=UPI002352AD9F